MKDGDLVRFRAPYWMGSKSLAVVGELKGSTWLMGLLVEYQAWEKIATIMYEGNILRIPARDVEKCGKKGVQRDD